MLALAALCGVTTTALGQSAASTVAAHSRAERTMIDRVNNGALSLAPVGFEENKGQVVTTDGQPAPFVRYRLSQGGTNIYLLDGGIAYQFSRTHLPEGYAELRMKKWRDAAEEARLEELAAQAHLETYRMDMMLEGADAHARVTTEGRSADYTNYYNHPGSTPDEVPLDVHTYTTVVYHEVYPGIDWSIAITEQGFAYDFILKPGADPDRIKLRFTDHEELLVDAEGNLVHGNRLGRFTEQRPVSFQDGAEVPTAFHMEGDLLSFEVGTYDPERALIIDPPRLWGTYYGGAQDDYAQGVAVDSDNNVYLAGWTSSTTAIASPGAHDGTWSAEDDGMVVKFDPDGTRLWGTYFGSTDGDAFAYCATDLNDNIYAGGITKSTSGIATSGVHQTSLGGDWDGLLVKFDASGTLQWATYYGGTLEDRVRGCTVDPSGNAYVTGFSFSTGAGVMASFEGAHQTSYGGGSTGEVYSRGDAFLAKFDPDGNRLWGTYYGGTSDDEGLDCATDASGNVYLAGGTGTSTGSSIATAGAHQSAFGSGGSDAFLVKFDAFGTRLWGTYYGGNASDYGFGCAVDGSGNVFLAGDTYSTNGTSIAAGGGHQLALGGDRDGFLAKFSTAGIRAWGTYYGGAAGESGRGCHADVDGYGYLIGETVSSNGIATPDGHQTVYGGGDDDAYLARFQPGGTRDYGTYYGGNARDNGYHCAVDGARNIYLVGETLSDNAIADGGHQNTRNGVFDAFLVKFGDVIDCAGVPNGNALPGTSCDDENSCTASDTWSAECVCAGTPVPGPTMGTVGSNSPICVSGTLDLSSIATGIGTISYSWLGPNSFGSILQNPSIANATVAATGTYTVTASNGCGTPAVGTIQAVVNPQPAATISYEGSPYCTNGGTATVTRTGTAGGSYSSTAGLSIDSGTGAVTLGTSTPGTYTVTYTIAAANGCALYTTTGNITLTAEPSAVISYPGSPYCGTGGTAAVTQTGTTGGTYSSTAGLSLNSGTGTVTLGTSTLGTYTVTYTVAAANGCALYTTTAPIVIAAGPSATIDYQGSPYCSTGGTATVNQTGSAGGAYTSTAGLSLNSATGAVNPGTSTPGSYTVTYTIPAASGCALFSTTAPITITAGPSATINYAGSPYCTSSGAAAVSQTGTTGGTYSSTAGLTVNSATGAVTPGTSTPGTYTVTYTITAGGGCTQFQTTASITVTGAASATISYPGSPYCSDEGTVAVNQTGTAGGTYSSTAGLSLNTTTGAVALGTSTAGTYTVTYTIAANGGCPQFQTTATITLSSAASATIGYAGSPYCSNEGTATVALTGTTGGAYSSTASLSLNSGTGAVVLATSTPGTYTVTYTIGAGGGCAQFQTTASITITGAASATIAYIGSPYCTTGGTAAVTQTGTTGGTYSSTAGLTLNSGTGAVTPGTSTAGTYTVTYTIAAAGGCPQFQTTAAVTITAATSWYLDQDSDGAGDPGSVQQACAAPNGYVANNTDGCPTDPAKTAAGICGCNVADTDSDGDGIANCNDNCDDLDGVQGDPCNDNDVLTINDVITTACICAGTPVSCVANADCNDNDNCTTDACLSNVCEYTAITLDTDGDGIPDCADDCPNVPGEIGTPCTDPDPCVINEVLNAGCVCTGTLDNTDTDGDGIPNCSDDCPTVPGEVGSTCDDGDACTINDLLDGACQCAGTFQDTDGDGVCDADDLCPGEPEPGTACDDGDVCTIGDAYQTDCECSGAFQDSDGDGVCDALDECPGGPEPGSTCDDNDICTINDVIQGDCTCDGTFVDDDGDGTCNPLDLCPGGPEPGTACDDADPCTIGDAIQADCDCSGTFQDSDADGTCDFEDVCPGNPEPGTPCDDLNALTINDVITTDCVCLGTVVNCSGNGDCNDNDLCTSDACVDFECVYTPEPDSDGDGVCDAIDQCPGGPEPGTACNDNNACTINDVIQSDCGCLGTFQDTDGDGTCDADDLCPGGPEPGTACDDGEPLTVGDAINAQCVCTGQEVECVGATDCDDQDPCTIDACVGSVCVNTPAVIGGITGPTWVVGGSDTTWSIAPITGATAYVWVLPSGWDSDVTTQSTLNATVIDFAGNTPLCVTVYLSTCALDTCLDVQVSPVGIADAAPSAQPWYTVRPNPSEGTFLMTRTDTGTEPVRFAVVDALGRVVLAPSFPNGQRVSTLYLGDASPGVYLLRMVRGNETQVLRLMVRR